MPGPVNSVWNMPSPLARQLQQPANRILRSTDSSHAIRPVGSIKSFSSVKTKTARRQSELGVSCVGRVFWLRGVRAERECETQAVFPGWVNGGWHSPLTVRKHLLQDVATRSEESGTCQREDGSRDEVRGET